MDLSSYAKSFLLLLCNVLSFGNAMRFEYCLWFQGSCELSCGPGTFPLYGTTWCSMGKLCCIRLITPATTTTTTTTTSRTTTSTTTTTTTPTTTTPTTTTTTTTTTTIPPTLPIPQCGVAYKGRELNSRIIGGREAEKCELPWMVHIALPTGPCGGAVIDSRHILTAAHCFWGSGSYTPEIVIGEYNRTENNPTEKFSTRDYSIIMHPGYIHEFYFNDIAIVKLKTAIDMDSYRCITPICLPSPNHIFPAGIDCLVAGWGVTEPEYDIFSPPIPQVLMRVTISVVAEELCKGKFGKYYNITTETCAGQLAGDKDSCDGDSGGPLMCQTGTGNEYYAAGIVSSGAGCAKPQTPAIYTDVITFLPWINSVIASGV